MSALLSAAPIVADSGTWSMGVKVGLPIACAAVLICLFAAIVACFMEDGWILAIMPGLAVPGIIIGCLFGYYPYGAEYHQYRDVSGTVVQISDRLIASNTEGGGSNQRFVVVLDGDTHPYGIDDTRASLLKEGDTVNLRCIREHDSGSSDDGYACKWGKS